MENILLAKSLEFALEIIDLYKTLISNKEFILSKQLLRSGTSVGANIEEANVAMSRKDFFHKMNIALKEAHETRYWLLLLEKGELCKDRLDLINIKYKNQEILKLLTKTTYTTSRKIIR